MKTIAHESQKTEYKSSWQDDYFEWICGYANSRGGRLIIGVNDDGYVVGLRDTRYLLDTLPNQVSSSMGIIIDIDHDTVLGRGENLKYNVAPDDIAAKPLNLYVRGLLTSDVLDDIEVDPEKVHNVTAGVQALFDSAPGFAKQLRRDQDYRDKIRSDLRTWDEENPVIVTPDGDKSDDIIYHDEIYGPLITQADKVVDLIYTKYLKALISYDGLQRITEDTGKLIRTIRRHRLMRSQMMMEDILQMTMVMYSWEIR